MLSRRDTWFGIGTFVAVTYAWSSIFMGMAIASQDITLVSAFGGCGARSSASSSPGSSSPTAGAGGVSQDWDGVGARRGGVTSWFLPALYVGLAHTAVWVFGLAGFTDVGPGRIFAFVLERMAMGLTIGAVLAFGEEVGWQGWRPSALPG